MTKMRNLNYGDRLPEMVMDSLMEYISTHAGPNFLISQVNSTTLQVVAGTDNAQAAVGINGRWRYNSATVNAAHPGGAGGSYDIYVTASDNNFVPSGNPPGQSPETDNTVYSFGLQILPTTSTPTTALYRKVGTCTWSGSAITDFTQTVGGTRLPAQTSDGTPVMDGTAARGSSPNWARADHIHPIDTSRAPLASPALTGVPVAPTAAVDTSTTQLATTAFVIGQAASATPLMNGAAAVGTSTRYARGDHVHPVDTSRAPLASPTFTGVPAAPTAAVDTSTTQLATTAFVIGQAAAATPLMNGAAAVGTSTRFARADHVHPIDTSRAPLASPSFSGVVSVASGLIVRPSAQGQVYIGTDANGNIELGNDANSPGAQTPYFDFHYNSGAQVGQDYNVRVMNSGDGQLDFSSNPHGGTNTLPFSIRNSGVVATAIDIGTSAAATGLLRIFTPVASTPALVIYSTTDAQPKLQVNNNGVIAWGPGGATVPDTNLYRQSSNNLRTDGAFWVGLGLVADAAATGQPLYIGGALDTTLSRPVGGQVNVVNKILEGNPAVSAVTVPVTFTPNLATGLIQRVQVNAGGAATLTIGAPTSPPPGSTTALLVVHIANFGGGTIGITWNAVYTSGNTLSLPANLATSKVTEVLFVWDGANWRIVSLG